MNLRPPHHILARTDDACSECGGSIFALKHGLTGFHGSHWSALTAACWKVLAKISRFQSLIEKLKFSHYSTDQ